MADWLVTAADWAPYWRDAPTGDYAAELLEIAKDDVLTWGQEEGLGAPAEGEVPARWRLAQAKQARALHINSLSNADDGDAIGMGDFQTTRRNATSSAEIRRLIRPLERLPRFG